MLKTLMRQIKEYKTVSILTPTFAALENMAQLICTFFTRSAEPSNPIPDVEKYLQENFTDPSMCLSKLSERFNMSESYLSHLFKDKTGQNFSTYLESLRLGEAVRRLGLLKKYL